MKHRNNVLSPHKHALQTVPVARKALRALPLSPFHVCSSVAVCQDTRSALLRPLSQLKNSGAKALSLLSAEHASRMAHLPLCGSCCWLRSLNLLWRQIRSLPPICPHVKVEEECKEDGALRTAHRKRSGHDAHMTSVWHHDSNTEMLYQQSACCMTTAPGTAASMVTAEDGSSPL